MSDTPPPEGNPSKVEPKTGSKGWIGNLAERSTGLPREEKSVPEDRSGDRSLWSLAGLKGSVRGHGRHLCLHGIRAGSLERVVPLGRDQSEFVGGCWKFVPADQAGAGR